MESFSRWSCRAIWFAAEPYGVCCRGYADVLETSYHRVIFERMLFSKVFITIESLFQILKNTTMIRFLLLHIFLARYCFCQLKQCYHTGGGLSTDLPCDPSANVSACCGQGWTCVTNFYCSQRGGKFVGTCTDQAWRDPACPFPYCQPIIP